MPLVRDLSQAEVKTVLHDRETLTGNNILD